MSHDESTLVPAEWIAAALVLAALFRCAGARERRDVIGAAYVIDDIHIVGVTRLKKKELVKYL